MRVLTPTELERMQGTQEGAMMDTGIILKFTETNRTDEYGMPVSPFVEGPVTVCGFDGNPKPEQNAPAGGGNQTQVEVSEARLRLPIDIAIENRDRVRITHRFGVLLEKPIMLELTENPRRGPSGLLVDVRRVTDGS